MATVADLRANFVTAIELLVAPAPVRLASDLRRDIERIDAGVTKYALSAFITGVAAKSSNATRQVVAVELGVLHRLSTATAERAFTEGALDTLLESLTDLAWWRALASVYAVDTAALPTIEVDRIGNVVRLEVSARVVLK